MPVPRPENLKPVKTKEEARKRGRNGGIKSGIAKRQKKLLSQIYGEFLADKYKVNTGGETRELTGEEFVKLITKEVLFRRDSASVSMLKEIREATEGSKVEHSGSVVIIDDIK